MNQNKTGTLIRRLRLDLGITQQELADETVIIRKRYPEWDLQTRLPRIPYGILVWYCTKHGLMYRRLR